MKRAKKTIQPLSNLYKAFALKTAISLTFSPDAT